MSTINHYYQLLQRELTGNYPKQRAHQIVENRMVQNIAQNHFGSRDIEIEDTLKPTKVAHSDHYIAMHQGLKTSLWDSFTGLKLWEYEQALSQDNFLYEVLLVDRSGTVIYFTSHEEDGFISTRKSAQIFFEGRNTGHVFLYNTKTDPQLINGYLFGIGTDGINPSDQLNLYQWDLDGRLINSVSLNEIKNNRGMLFACNEQYAVVAADYTWVSFITKIVIFEFKTKKTKEIDLNFILDECFLQGNQLFCGLSRKGYYRRLTVLNVETGKVQKVYTFRSVIGEINQIKADNNNVVFILNSNFLNGDLWHINLLNHEKKILLRNVSSSRLSIVDSVLCVIAPDGQTITFIDLITGKIINRRDCLPYSLGMSFKAGVLQRFGMSGGVLRIKLENYLINNESVEDLPFHSMTI